MTKKVITVSAILFLLTASISCKRGDMSSDKGKYSYAIGMQIGNNIKRQNIDLDLDSMKDGIQDALSGAKSKITEEDIKNAMKTLNKRMRGDKNDTTDIMKTKKEGEDYLNSNKAKNGVNVTKSGLQYEIMKTGTGPTPRVDETVRVHYRGTLVNGTEFDSSFKRNQPAEFQVNRVIPGWTEALQLMNKGAKFKLSIPSNLAYGEDGTSGIPGNSVLIFDVELLDIVKK